ncbi:MAG: gamma-glutamyl-gamma-aminobutyrate hydrolase family protein [Oligoflexia bacterium]|nr:gamma-glutamyl-gamma-aminobutyrate hydrolase family protein [Oligoflexia bacterium]
MNSINTMSAINKITIINFGGQYTHLIAKRIRSFGVFAEIVSPEKFFSPSNRDSDRDSDRDCDCDCDRDSNYNSNSHTIGLILSGGPNSVNNIEKTDPSLWKNLLALPSCKLPILGICFGHQLLAKISGGEITSTGVREYGPLEISIDIDIDNNNNNNDNDNEPGSAIFKGVPKQQTVWMSHGDSVVKLPSDFKILSKSSDNIIAFARSSSHALGSHPLNGHPLFGLQFHPEVTHTQYGINILENFVRCCNPRMNCTTQWRAPNIVANIIDRIKTKVQKRKVVIFVSGGVDSLVTLALCHKAIPLSQIFPIHIDTGLMRKNESAMVCAHLKKMGFDNLKLLDAKEKFISALHGITSPEEKRKIIGKLFVDLFQNALNGHSGDWLLAQGTIYPDVIESGGGSRGDRDGAEEGRTESTTAAEVIKTHHNRVPEILELERHGRLLEPIRELYKDEVRLVGKELSLPEELLSRHPFPGPGLAIRILCHDGQWQQQSISLPLPTPIAIAHKNVKTVLLPINSVGVQGDQRTYRRPLLVYTDQNTNPNHWINSWPILKSLATNLINSHSDINRVIYSLTIDTTVATATNTATTFEVRKTLVDKQSIEQLQEVDDLFQQHLLTPRSTSQHPLLWQMPVVALPLYAQHSHAAKVYVIRPVTSEDGMTSDVYQFNLDQLKATALKIKSLAPQLIADICIDITSKPPGTIEWE